MTMSQAENHSTPIADLNTTPLIDVMLVLLIMFIITIPMATHSVKVNLPQKGEPGIAADVDLTKNILSVSAQGTILWNGHVTTRDGLKDRLRYALNLATPPMLFFKPDSEARYEIVNTLLSDIKRSGTTRLAFIGNERFDTF